MTSIPLLSFCAGVLAAIGATSLGAWSHRARARRILAGWSAPRDTSRLAAGDDVVIEGSLAVATADASTRSSDAHVVAVTTLPRGGELLESPIATARTESERLVVVSGKDRVAIASPYVLVGSIERRARGVAGATRVLRAGDEVRARGRVRTLPGDAAHYRDERSAFELVPIPGEAVVSLVTRQWLRPGLGVFATAAIAAGVTAVAMTMTMRPAPDATGVTTTDVDARAAWLAGDFDAASRAFLAHAARGKRAGHATEIAAHLLAGRNADAAASARAMADSVSGDDGDTRNVLHCLADALGARGGDEEARRRLATRASVAQMPRTCLVLHADTLEPNTRASAIAQHHTPRYSQEHKAFGAMLFEWKDRDAYALELLTAEATREGEPAPLSVYPMRVLNGAKEQGLTIPLATRGSWRAASDLLTSVMQSYAGEHEEAAATYARMLEANGLAKYRAGAGRASTFAYQEPAATDVAMYGDEPWEVRKLAHRHEFFFGAVLATRAGRTKEARALLAMAVEEAHGRAALEPYLELLEARRVSDAKGALDRLERDEPWPPHKELWGLVKNGDGEALRAALRRTNADGRGVLRWVAHLEELMPALSTFLAKEYPPPCWTCGPHVLFDALAGERELAQAVGNDAREAALAKRIGRLAAAFVRRDVNVPLYALGRVTLGIK